MNGDFSALLMKGILCNETELSLLPFVENPKLELEQYLKEQERYGDKGMDVVYKAFRNSLKSIQM